MTMPFPLVSTQQYRSEAKKWLQALSRGEHVSVVFFPKTDRLRRLTQMLEEQTLVREALGRTSAYMFQLIDFSLTFIEDQGDTEEYIARMLNIPQYPRGVSRSFSEWMEYLQEKNIRLVLILPDMEKYLTKEASNILAYLSYIISQYTHTVLVLGFFEADIRHKQYQPHFPASTFFYENVFYYPLYERDDTLTFITYLDQKWGMHISPDVKEEIYRQCGGHFWFVKEAVRQISHSGTWSQAKESMKYRVETVYNLLAPSEQQLLMKCVTGVKSLSQDEEQSQEYFQRMGIMDEDGSCVIGLFEEYVRALVEENKSLNVQQDRIMFNHVPVEKIFPRKEYRVLQVLMERRGEVVSREEIAKRLWPDETDVHYSDWAIDQVIARIRKRFTEIGMASQMIRSVRGKGYTLAK